MIEAVDVEIDFLLEGYQMVVEQGKVGYICPSGAERPLSM